MNAYEHGREDFDWMIGLNRISLKMIGCWPEESKNRILKDVYILWILSIQLIGHFLPQVYALTKVINELPLVLDNGYVMMALTTAVAEQIILWRSNKQLGFIIKAIETDCFKWKENWERDIMLSTAAQGRFLSICLFCLAMSSVTGMMFGPMIGIDYRIINNITDYGVRSLPTQTYYPFDYSVTPYFELTYVIQILSVTLATFSLMCPVALCGSIVCYSCGQIAILGTKVKNLSEIGKVKEDYRFKWQLKGIIDTHTRIIRLIHKIASILKNFALAQVVASSATMLCLGFQIMNTLDSTTKSTPVTMITAQALIVSTHIMLIFIYCVAGETLAYHCEEMNKKIYDIDWYCWPPKNALDLLQLMIGAQQQLSLSAGQFFELNYQSFTSILKTVAGYVSVLIAVQKK